MIQSFNIGVKNTNSRVLLTTKIMLGTAGVKTFDY
jgi:hypothetical protein